MENFTTIKKANSYDGVSSPFACMAKEVKALGMKKPSETLSASKVKFINRVLIDIRAFMEGEPEVRYLDLLDDEALPQYSDAILVLSQYEGALSAFRSRYHRFLGIVEGHGWAIK